MIAQAKVKETERLLAVGNLSQRRIAALVGVSRATVASIASGNRPDYEARMMARLEDNRPLGPLARCGGCGGMVYMPCLLCRVRAIKAHEHEVRRARRRDARERSLRRLLLAVRRAHWQRDDNGHVRRTRQRLSAADVEDSTCNDSRGDGPPLTLASSETPASRPHPGP